MVKNGKEVKDGGADTSCSAAFQVTVLVSLGYVHSLFNRVNINNSTGLR